MDTFCRTRQHLGFCVHKLLRMLLFTWKKILRFHIYIRDHITSAGLPSVVRNLGKISSRRSCQDSYRVIKISKLLRPGHTRSFGPVQCTGLQVKGNLVISPSKICSTLILYCRTTFEDTIVVGWVVVYSQWMILAIERAVAQWYTTWA